MPKGVSTGAERVHSRFVSPDLFISSSMMNIAATYAKSLKARGRASEAPAVKAL